MNLLERLKLAQSFSEKNPAKDRGGSIYDIQLTSLMGEPITLSNFRGRYILVVNVASECGFTGQYKALEKLANTYKNDLVVIGVPCNQFGGQEPGTPTEIATFCQVNYGVTFSMTQKMDVKGNQQHDLYKWLTNKELNGKFSSSVKWNFQKYLIDRGGNLIDVFYSITDPLSRKITKHIQ